MTESDSSSLLGKRIEISADGYDGLSGGLVTQEKLSDGVTTVSVLHDDELVRQWTSREASWKEDTSQAAKMLPQIEEALKGRKLLGGGPTGRSKLQDGSLTGCSIHLWIETERAFCDLEVREIRTDDTALARVAMLRDKAGKEIAVDLRTAVWRLQGAEQAREEVIIEDEGHGCTVTCKTQNKRRELRCYIRTGLKGDAELSKSLDVNVHPCQISVQYRGADDSESGRIIHLPFPVVCPSTEKGSSAVKHAEAPKAVVDRDGCILVRCFAS